MQILQETAKYIERMGLSFDSITIDRAVVGLFFTGVKLSIGSGGVCYTPVKEIPKAVCCPSSAGRIFPPEDICGMSVTTILGGIDSYEPIKTALAIATLNALSAHCWESGIIQNNSCGYEFYRGMDAIDAVALPAQKSVAVVGAFVPILKALKKRGGQWWVIEKEDDSLRGDELSHYVHFNQAESVIAGADILIITGVTLLNHSLETILAWAKQDAHIAVMGPTASALPEPMFARGVDIVGGVLVTEPDKILDIISLGGSGYHFLDKYAERLVIKRKIN